MIFENVKERVADLEKQELETQGANGVVSPNLYTQLLALYLYQNDLCNAKYLWQRIPDTVKTSTPELAFVWAVGRCMWSRDLPGTYEALKVTWSEHISDIMVALQDNVRTRAANLIGEAYSSVSLETVGSMTGVPLEALPAACIERGWRIDESIDGAPMVHPCRPIKPPCSVASSEDQLFKLTEFVSFLEN